MDTPQDGQPTDDFATIPDVPIPSNPSGIFNPNQVRSGVGRGAPIINYGADGNPQVLQGNQATFGNGFYVAKPGIDVTSTTNPADFIFNSGQDVFKIVQTGTVTLDATAAVAGIPNFATVTHNLGFVPIPLVFLGSGSSYTPLPLMSSIGASGGSLIFSLWHYSTTTATQLIITLITGTTANWGTFPYKYYLLQETAN